MLTNAKVIAVVQSPLVPNANKRAVGGAQIAQREAAAVETVQHGVPAAHERIIREHEITGLSADCCLRFVDIKHVSRNPLHRTLN